MVYLLLFLFGICVGSFLNVVIDRLPHNKSIFFGRSHCDSCKKKLSPLDLVPLLSFFFLGGKCRHCHKKISVQYPLIELLTGAMFVLTVFLSLQSTVYSLQQIALLGYDLFIISCLIAIFFIDLKYGIIPDEIIYLLSFITFLYLVLNTKYLLLPNLFSAIISFLFLFFIYFLTKGKGMGFGDVKLAFFMGLFLGFPKIITAFYVAFLTGAALSIILILLGKKKFKGSTIAFGPFLVIGTYISLFWGEQIIRFIFRM